MFDCCVLVTVVDFCWFVRCSYLVYGPGFGWCVFLSLDAGCCGVGWLFDFCCFGCFRSKFWLLGYLRLLFGLDNADLRWLA